MSGFRDDELDKKLNEVGANLTSAVSKNTFAVIVKDITKITGKVEKAKEKGIKTAFVNHRDFLQEENHFLLIDNLLNQSLI